MEYWVAMQEDELQVAMMLLGKRGLPGITEIDDTFEPDPALIERMVEKKFLEKTEHGMGWNPFVQTVMWCAAHAQSELRVSGSHGFLLRLFFYGEDMVLMRREQDEDMFRFFYVPLLPKAIGGLARFLEDLEPAMPPRDKSEAFSLTVPERQEYGADLLLALLTECGPAEGADEPAQLMIDGWTFGAHTLALGLAQTKRGVLLASPDDAQLKLEPTDYYHFLETVSRWIVRTHGQSIAAKEAEHGTAEG